MIQWLLRKTINGMGRVYVILDSFLKDEGGPILGLEIDDDFEKMNRRELCRYVEAKFCCQIARNNKFKVKKK